MQVCVVRVSRDSFILLQCDELPFHHHMPTIPVWVEGCLQLPISYLCNSQGFLSADTAVELSLNAPDMCTPGSLGVFILLLMRFPLPLVFLEISLTYLCTSACR